MSKTTAEGPMKLSEKIKGMARAIESVSIALRFSLSRREMDTHAEDLKTLSRELHKDASQLEQAQTWIPVSERLPEARPLSKLQDYVLVHNGNHAGVGSLWDAEDGEDPRWIDEIAQLVEPPPTHWMPLPPSPEVLNPT